MSRKIFVMLEQLKSLEDLCGGCAQESRDFDRVGPGRIYSIDVKPASQIGEHVDHIVEFGYQEVNVFPVDRRDKAGVQLAGNFVGKMVAFNLDLLDLLGV